MNIATIEANIVTQLKSEITTFNVEAFPANVRQWQQTHPNGSILVRFGGYSIETPPGLPVVTQDVTAIFVLSLLSRNLVTHTGIYTMEAQVAAALRGYTATVGCDSAVPIYPVSMDFVELESGTWHYELRYAFTGEETFEST